MNPANAIGGAVEIIRITTDQEPDDRNDVPALSAAAQLGKLGGAARAKALTPEKRTTIARNAAMKRWQKA